MKFKKGDYVKFVKYIKGINEDDNYAETICKYLGQVGIIEGKIDNGGYDYPVKLVDGKAYNFRADELQKIKKADYDEHIVEREI